MNFYQKWKNFMNYFIFFWNTRLCEFLNWKKKKKNTLNIDYVDNMLFMMENYIKDLTQLGRDIRKIIIVDNFTFKLQRNNSIWIKSFYGDCVTHRNTILSVILEKIRFDTEETNDIRDCLRKEQHLIISIITSNLWFK